MNTAEVGTQRNLPRTKEKKPLEYEYEAVVGDWNVEERANFPTQRIQSEDYYGVCIKHNGQRK
jgi:hypothetical protein